MVFMSSFLFYFRLVLCGGAGAADVRGGFTSAALSEDAGSSAPRLTIEPRAGRLGATSPGAASVAAALAASVIAPPASDAASFVLVVSCAIASLPSLRVARLANRPCQSRG